MNNQDRSLKGSLTEHEEKLILRYLDRQANLIDKFKIKRLLSKNAAAGEYLGTMKNLGEKLRADAHSLSFQSTRVDLWNRISNRIDQEQRAELFLGRRQATSVRPNAFHNLFSRPLYVGAGAFATAAVMLLIVPMLRTTGGGTTLGVNPEQMASRIQLSTPAVNLVSTGRERPRIIEEGVPTSMEVDWMRSNGRVRVIQDPTDSSAIIWVKKRGNLSSVYRTRRTVAPFPTLVEQVFDQQK